MIQHFKDLLRKPQIRLPDFLGLGAQRSGTTTLHMLLRKHPEAFVPEVKEVQYFSLHYNRKIHWYTEHFAKAEAGHRAGEITPYYLYHPKAPERIATTLPHVRLVVLLRDPVERALSGYFHAIRHGMETLPMKDAFNAEPERLRRSSSALDSNNGRHQGHSWHSYLARSRYDEQINRYLNLFSREQLLLVRSEDLFNNHHSAWKKIQEFLGLSVYTAPEQLFPTNGAARNGHTISESLRARLRRELEPTYVAMQEEYGIFWP